MNEPEADSSLADIPIARQNRRKTYHNLAPPPRVLPLRLHWNLLGGRFPASACVVDRAGAALLFRDR